MAAAVLDISNLRYAVGSTTILDGVSFAAEDGEYVSVIGPNGAGKTSLIKCLNRINPISSGDVTVFGKALGEYRQRELAKHLSYVPQAEGQAFPFSVREFVLMGRYPYLSAFSSLTVEDNAKVDAVLALTRLEPFAGRTINTLSGGERQKVFIAAALAQGARLLLLDEPTTFLDYKHQVDVTELLQRLNRDEGITIVSVTHDVNRAVFAGSKVVALKAGKTAFVGTPDALLTEGVLESIYDTAFTILNDAESDAPIVLAKGSTP